MGPIGALAMAVLIIIAARIRSHLTSLTEKEHQAKRRNKFNNNLSLKHLCLV